MDWLDAYTSGIYLEKNPGWHVEESPWKVRHILRMLERHGLDPGSVCDVGCGAGEVLRLLQGHLGPACELRGYDISPEAVRLCGRKANDRLRFKLADIREEREVFFDLLLVLDVVEHVEDYMVFLRDLRGKARMKLFHIPLEVSVQGVLRGKIFLQNHDAHGHLHYFTKETALRTLEDAGYEVIDYSYSLELEKISSLRDTSPIDLARKLFFAIHKDWAVRLLGGARLFVLAR